MLNKKSLIFFSIFFIGSCLITPDLLPRKPEKDKRYNLVREREQIIIGPERKPKPSKKNKRPEFRSNTGISQFQKKKKKKPGSVTKHSGIPEEKRRERMYRGVGSSRSRNYRGVLRPRSKTKLYIYKTKKGKKGISNYYPEEAIGKIKIIEY